MDKISVNLIGTVCPYPVMMIIEQAENLKPGASISFIVDDPLAIKSATEELEDDEDIKITIEPCKEGWNITLVRAE